MTQIISKSELSQVQHQERINDINQSVISAIKDRIFCEIKKSIQKTEGIEIGDLDSMLTLTDMYISRAEFLASSNRKSMHISPLLKKTIKTAEDIETIDSLIKSAPLHNELTFIQIFSIKILNEINSHQDILPKKIKEDFLDLIDNLSTIYMECLYLTPQYITPPYKYLNAPLYFGINPQMILNITINEFLKKHNAIIYKNPELKTLNAHLNILLKLLNVFDNQFSLYSIEHAEYSECTTPVSSAYEFIPVCNLTIERISNFIRKKPPKCKIGTEINLKNIRDQFCELVSLLEKIPLLEEEKEIFTTNNKNIRNLCLIILKNTSKYSTLLDKKLYNQEISNKEFAEYQNQIKQVNFVIDKIISNLPEIDSVNIRSVSARAILLSSITSFSKIDTSETFTATEKKDKKKLAKIAQKIDSLSSVTILKEQQRFDDITFSIAHKLLPIYRPADIKFSFESICLTIDSTDNPTSHLHNLQKRENPIISKNIISDDHYPFDAIYSAFNERLDFTKFSAEIKQIHNEISTLIASVSPESLTSELETSICKAIYARCQKHLLQCMLYADMNLMLNQEETTFENLFPESLLDILLFKVPKLDETPSHSDSKIAVDETPSHSDSKIAVNEEAPPSADSILAAHEDLGPKDELLKTEIQDEFQAVASSSIAPISKRGKNLARQYDAAYSSSDDIDAEEHFSVSVTDLVDRIHKEKKTRKIISLLTSLGFKKEPGKGSHLHLRSPEGKLIVIPFHEELKLGTKKSITNSLKCIAD